MKFIQNIRTRIGFSILNRKVKHLIREKVVCNFGTAKTVGIVFHPPDKNSFDYIMQFFRFLSEMDIELFIIGYIDSKTIPDYYVIRKGINFFSKKDINWYGKPIVPYFSHFINQKFDMLIDLCIEDLFPILYFVNLSNAKFKIGKFSVRKNPYDLMIDIKKEKRVGFLVDQIKHYLSIINKSS